MKLSKAFIILISCAVLLTCNTSKKDIKSNTEKPNIILILSDDMGYSDITPYGREINTPKLIRSCKKWLKIHSVL